MTCVSSSSLANREPEVDRHREVERRRDDNAEPETHRVPYVAESWSPRRRARGSRRRRIPRRGRLPRQREIVLQTAGAGTCRRPACRPRAAPGPGTRTPACRPAPPAKNRSNIGTSSALSGQKYPGARAERTYGRSSLSRCRSLYQLPSVLNRRKSNSEPIAREASTVPVRRWPERRQEEAVPRVMPEREAERVDLLGAFPLLDVDRRVLRRCPCISTLSDLWPWSPRTRSS